MEQASITKNSLLKPILLPTTFIAARARRLIGAGFQEQLGDLQMPRVAGDPQGGAVLVVRLVLEVCEGAVDVMLYGGEKEGKKRGWGAEGAVFG